MSNNHLSHKEQNQKIIDFLSAFQDGVDAWKRAGTILVELVDADPHVYTYIIEQCPAMNAQTLGKFEAMGRGLLHPSLAMDKSAGGRQLSKLPLSVQEKFTEESIPVLIRKDDGETDVLLVKYQDLTPDQARQVFRSGRLASEGEQRAWIEDFILKTRTKKASADDKPWQLTNKELVVGNVRFNASQLAQFLAQLTK